MSSGRRDLTGSRGAWLLALPVLCCAGHVVLLAVGAGSLTAALGGSSTSPSPRSPATSARRRWSRSARGCTNGKSQADRDREDAVRPGPPYRIAAEKTASLLGLDLSGTALDRAALGFHSGLAVSWAPTYALLRRRARLGPVAAGLASGAAMSAIVDEGLTPALGSSAPNSAAPPSRPRTGRPCRRRSASAPPSGRRPARAGEGRRVRRRRRVPPPAAGPRAPR